MNERLYLDSGIDREEVHHDFPDFGEYEETLRIYLKDDYFQQLQEWIAKEDYAMAADAAKGLYVLAAELKVFSLYTALLDVYEDLVYEDYKDIREHALSLRQIHQKLLKVWQ